MWLLESIYSVGNSDTTRFYGVYLRGNFRPTKHAYPFRTSCLKIESTSHGTAVFFGTT